MRHKRRTCAKLCHDSGGELEQIQFLLGHASVQTTERYLGCKQNLGHPVNDLFDLRKNLQLQAMGLESAAMNGSTPVEMLSRHE
jgi:integrase